MPATFSPRRGAPRSLKARALQWLAQREQSRVELRRKLLRAVAAEADAAAAHAAAGNVETTSATDADAAQQRVDEVLDWLEAHGYLCAERFVESRVNARSARYGNLRIRQELQQHQLTVGSELDASLRASEVERARAVRSRRFAEPPVDAAGRAKQARFLTARGFSSDAVRAALRPSSGESTGDDAA